MRVGFFFALVATSAVVCVQSARPSAMPQKTERNDPAARTSKNCVTCRSIAESFYAGVAKTARKIDFAGGNPEGWTKENEKFLGRYAMNEARLVEILEDVCGKKTECHDLLEDVEETIEKWWARRPGSSIGGESVETWTQQGLVNFMCVDKHEFCCRDGFFGKDCLPCSGSNDGKTAPCGGHGRCDGDGERRGEGVCLCLDGYTGNGCEQCRSDFFRDISGDCKRCSLTCLRSCSGSGPGDCDQDGCASGYTMVDGICSDVDECAETATPPRGGCTPTQFCHNFPGSFHCANCHENCQEGAGCTGVSEADCAACKAGSELIAGKGCVDIDECALIPCAAAETCRNTIGSFWCSCVAPATEFQSVEDGTKPCLLPEVFGPLGTPTSALPPANPLLTDTTPPPAEVLANGTVTVGPSPSRFKSTLVDFATPLAATPRIWLAGYDVSDNNTFWYHARDVTKTGFELWVARTDKQHGWGQELEVSWAATTTAVDTGAEKDEL